QIFSRILEGWKFNHNLTSVGSCVDQPIYNPDCAGTIGCWLLNGNTTDGSPNKLDTRTVGTVTFPNSQAAKFTGDPANYLEVDDAKLKVTTGLTIVADIYPEGPGGDDTLGGGTVVGREGEYMLFRNANGTIAFAFGDVNGVGGWFNGGRINTSFVAPFRQWTHVMVTVDEASKAAVVYANGKSIYSTTSPAMSGTIGDAVPTQDLLRIGYRQGSDTMPNKHAFQGKIAGVKLYNRALTPAEIQTQYQGACSINPDCSTNNSYRCTSDKAKLSRDLIRQADLYEMNILLQNYKTAHGGKCPTLPSGTYVPTASISTWPSWRDTLGVVLGAELPLDPINQLGQCKSTYADLKNYNIQTCWSEKLKLFADPNPLNTTFELPVESYAYWYKSSPDGQTCGFYTNLETELDCQKNGTCITPIDNSLAPVISCGSLRANGNTEFNGYFSVTGARLPITTVIDTSLSVWTGWSAPPVLQVSRIKEYKKLWAANAGAIGSYKVKVTATDKVGSTTQSICPITITKGLPYVFPIADKTIHIGTLLRFNIKGSEKTKQYPLQFTLDGGPSITTPPHDSNQLICGNVTDVGLNQTCEVNQIVSWPEGQYDVKVTVMDTKGDVSMPVFFKLNMTNDPPIINPISCTRVLRWQSTYPDCTIGAKDPENDEIIQYYIASEPKNLVIAGANTTALISGSITLNNAEKYNPYTVYNMEVWAVDKWGDVGPKVIFPIRVNTFCQDGVKQASNGEGGNECCDGAEGVAGSAASSNASNQYACTASCGCTGGWCGNGDTSGLQASYEQCDLGSARNGVGANTCSASCQMNLPAGCFILPCVRNTNCDPKPASADWNGASTYTQTLQDDGTWLPLSVTTEYDTTPGECNYNCAPGDVWDSVTSQCVGAGQPVCAGGQVWDGTSCVCPVGTTWDGIICRAALKCPNGVVDTAAPDNEECDPNVADQTVQCNGLVAAGIRDSDGSAFDCSNLASNKMSLTEIAAAYSGICKPNCKFGCQDASKKMYLNSGCYIGQAAPNAVVPPANCTKGLWSCSNDALTCVDYYGGTLKDLCCSGQGALLASSSITVHPGRAADAVQNFTPLNNATENNLRSLGGWDIGWAGSWDLNQHSYYSCDMVCKNQNKVCIGVGFQDPAALACQSVVHDDGSCINPGNTSSDDCKSLYSLFGASTQSLAYWNGRVKVIMGVTSLTFDDEFIKGYTGTCPYGVPSEDYRVGEARCYCKQL
ncbi:MAG: LamG domain-containing protein, partial [Candidatus Falkowbacteria bacterium]